MRALRLQRRPWNERVFQLVGDLVGPTLWYYTVAVAETIISEKEILSFLIYTKKAADWLGPVGFSVAGHKLSLLFKYRTCNKNWAPSKKMGPAQTYKLEQK